MGVGTSCSSESACTPGNRSVPGQTVTRNSLSSSMDGFDVFRSFARAPPSPVTVRQAMLAKNPPNDERLRSDLKLVCSRLDGYPNSINGVAAAVGFWIRIQQ